jgi:hypothetical protein
MNAVSVSSASRRVLESGLRVWGRARFAALAAAAVMLLAATASAQGYGTITGVVTDPTGAVVPGAKVTALRVGTGETVTTTTSKEGLFVFPSLRPARYEIAAASAGFSVFTQTGIVLQADAALTVNIVLRVGGATENVNVEANAAQVNLTSQTLSQVIDEKRVQELPLNGRNAAALTTLVAGVVDAPTAQADQGQTKTFPVAVTVSANGSRTGQMSYLLDGGNNVDQYTNVNAPFPFPDALQEFSVQTANYNAEYGQNAGGVVNIVTKSGTQEFHGSVFEYNRNPSLNAANYFSRDPNDPTKKLKDQLKRNQFGATLGGPLKLPGDSTAHTFFFLGYQKTILKNDPVSSSAAYVPTQDQVNGIFQVANASQCVKNPFTGASYPCTATASSPGVSTIDPATYDPASVALLRYLPKGDASGAVYFRRPVRQNMDEAIARVDHEFGESDRMSVRYFYDRFRNDGVLDLSNLLTYSDQATIGYHNALLSETHVFSDRLLNTFTFGYQRELSERGPLDGSINVNDLGVNMWQPTFKQINQIQVVGGFTIGDNPHATFYRRNLAFSDDLRWVKGSHSLAFGLHAEFSRVEIHNEYRQPGTFTFNANDTNNATASYLLGYLFQVQQASGQFFDNSGKFFGFYLQDSWKAHRRLTLNVGLRYEPFVPWRETEDRMGEFDPEAYAAGTHSTVYPNAPAGLLFAGDPGVKRDGIRAVYTDIMPRVGFAWDLFGNGKTSLRGGAGLFYDTRISSVFNNIYSNGSPFVTQVSITKPKGTFSDPYAGTTNPFPAPQPPAKNTTFPTQSYLTFDPYHDFEVPRSWAWNVALEHQLTGSILARIAYVGSRGQHLWVPVELNPTRYDSAAGTTSPRVYAPIYSQQITEAAYTGNTRYHGLQTSIEMRVARRLTVLANYTLSKATDDLPLNASVTAIGANASYVLPVYEPNYTRLDDGPSDFDRRHVASLSYVWELPNLQSGWLRYLLNDWQVSGILQYRTGQPLTIVSNSSNNSQSGQNRDQAVATGADPYASGACAGVKSPCKEYLNPAAFTVNPKGTYGTTGKGSLEGPDYFNWDVSLVRRIPFGKTVRAELRLEFFNVLNHTNFNAPNTAAGNGSFGRITGAGDPRIGQLSLRIVF